MRRGETRGKESFLGRETGEGKNPNRQIGSTQAETERTRRNSITNAAVPNAVLAGPSPTS